MIGATKQIPCRGCRHLSDLPKERHGDLADSFKVCTFNLPVSAYWMTPYAHEMSRWRSVRSMDGPFADDVKRIECKAREEAQ